MQHPIGYSRYIYCKVSPPVFSEGISVSISVYVLLYMVFTNTTTTKYLIIQFNSTVELISRQVLSFNMYDYISEATIQKRALVIIEADNGHESH